MASRFVVYPEDWEQIAGTIKKKSASITKRKLSDLPNIRYRLQAEQHYAPLIRQAIAGSVSGVAAAITEALSKTQKAPSGELAIARAAVAKNVTLSGTKLAEIFVKMRTDAGHVGILTASEELGDGHNAEHEFAQTALGIDWDNWHPGDPTASALTGRHAKSIENVGLHIDGILSTTTDRISQLIANGMTEGSTAREIADSIGEYVDSEDRAMMIAITETNMAYNLAAVDSYADSGITQWSWLAYDDDKVCDTCSDNDGKQYDVSEEDVPPEHPSCRCTVQAVFSTGQEDSNE